MNYTMCTIKITVCAGLLCVFVVKMIRYLKLKQFLQDSGIKVQLQRIVNVNSKLNYWITTIFEK